APLALQVHRVEHLLAHQALVQRARELDEAVGQGRFSVVDMGHDTEVADVILAHVGLKYSHPSRPVCYGPRMTDDGERGILREELPWLPSPAGSTPPPTAAPYGSPPTVTCPRKVIPVCVSRGCGAAASSRWSTGGWWASTACRPSAWASGPPSPRLVPSTPRGPRDWRPRQPRAP